ncbi:MAG: type II toxin-antitoxin system VapC family toxin [Methylocystis sp.]
MNGPEFLLDTNVVIGHLGGHESARALLVKHNAQLASLAVSQITRMELLGFPGLTGEDQSRIETLLSGVTVILLDEKIETEAIALRRRARLKPPDAIIAATAMVHGLKLLTLDERLRDAVGL